MNAFENLLEDAGIHKEKISTPSPWNSKQELQRWYGNLFGKIIELGQNDEFACLSFDFISVSRRAKDLYSLDLSASRFLRPPDGSLSLHEIDDAFCNAACDLVTMKTEFGSTKDSKAVDRFMGWIVNSMYSVVAVTPKFGTPIISPEILFRQAEMRYRQDLGKSQRNEEFSELGSILGRKNDIALLISIFYVCHREKLWAQLRDIAELRQESRVNVWFRLIEILLNCYADKNIRYEKPSAQLVIQIFKSWPKYVKIDPDLTEEKVLQYLKLPIPEPTTGADRKTGSATPAKPRRAKHPKALPPRKNRVTPRNWQKVKNLADEDNQLVEENVATLVVVEAEACT